MIEGEVRREQIMQTLADTEKPVNANKFAKTSRVSRQIVVGGITLSRATGKSIMTIVRGYILETEETNTGHVSKITAQHGKDQTEEELRLVIKSGSEIIDVTVEHPLYGELAGTLRIKMPQGIDSFMRRCQRNNATLLSKLTGGIHLHAIHRPEKHMLKNIKQKLAKAKILYEG